MDHLKLERLSICELGMMNMIRGGKVVGQGWREVAAIPLPGFEKSLQLRLPHDEGITSIKPHRDHFRQVPLYLADIDQEREASRAT